MAALRGSSQCLGRRLTAPVAAAGSSARRSHRTYAPKCGVVAPFSHEKPSVHDGPSVVRPGQIVDTSTVIRNWWCIPAVGFNSILEIPIHKFERLSSEDPSEIGTVIVPNSVFGQPLRKDLLHKAYIYHRRKIAGYDKSMQMFKWEWPGSNKKVRSQKRSGKARMGRRKAPSFFDGVHAHALRPKDWGGVSFQHRTLWKVLKTMLSAKFAHGNITVVDSFNLESHKTRHLVRHLRALLGTRCHSALLVHEGNVDVNDNCRWASAHIPAIRRENVEGINVYNLLKYHELVITETALAKLIKSVQTYPQKKGWGQKFATPDGKPAPVPAKVPGWNNAWVKRKERLVNAEFRAKEFFQESQKWTWSIHLKGALKVPMYDPLLGFRVKDFVQTPEKPVWDKLESLYADDEPLEEEVDVDEFDDLVASLDHDGERQREGLAPIQDASEIRLRSLRALAVGADGRRRAPNSRNA